MSKAFRISPRSNLLMISALILSTYLRSSRPLSFGRLLVGACRAILLLACCFYSYVCSYLVPTVGAETIAAIYFAPGWRHPMPAVQYWPSILHLRHLIDWPPFSR